VRVDHKLLGYQLAAYFDKPTARVQLIVSSIAENDNLKICADGALLSKHKVTVRVELLSEINFSSEIIYINTIL